MFWLHRHLPAKQALKSKQSTKGYERMIPEILRRSGCFTVYNSTSAFLFNKVSSRRKFASSCNFIQNKVLRNSSRRPKTRHEMRWDEMKWVYVVVFFVLLNPLELKSKFSSTCYKSLKGTIFFWRNVFECVSKNDGPEEGHSIFFRII